MPAVFDWAESDSSRVGTQTRVRKAQFGDGYEQRSPNGLNPVVQIWNLRFEEIDNLYADEIEAFLEAQGGSLAFDWTPKWGTSAIRVVCESWTREIASTVASSMSAEFRQVFEP